MTTYGDINEAIEHEIIPAIEAGDATAIDYDLRAIADEVIERVSDDNRNPRYAVTADPADFWAAVERHAL